jgi:hypothetical protein
VQIAETVYHVDVKKEMHLMVKLVVQIALLPMKQVLKKINQVLHHRLLLRD